MRKIFLALLAILALPNLLFAETLTYEGKAIAQMTREIKVPFPMLVDRLFVKIGDVVRDKEKLLEYHLDAKDARFLQRELMTGDDQADIREVRSHIEQEALEARAQRAYASDLAAKGLGPQAEAAKRAGQYNLLQARLQAIKQKEAASAASYSLRLKELESYFGHALKVGQAIPHELFLTAPMAATVIEISPQARALGRIEANATAMTLAVLNPIQVQIQVYESEITRLAIGGQVTVEVVNKNGAKLPGKVSMLSWQPVDTAIAVPSFYNVYIDVDNPDHLIKPGYKVLVHIEAD